MGDLSKFLAPENGPIIDLSWLEVPEGYENFPGLNTAQNVVPQLEASGWGGMPISEPKPVAAYVTSVKLASDYSESVVLSAKKAAMLGANIPSYLQERFTDAQIKMASEGLAKVASEVGLLGRAYIDLSPFQTVKHAMAALGPQRTRLASFVVGAPQDESHFTDENGNCKEIGLPVSSDTDSKFTPDVLKNYEKHLKSSGLIPEDYVIDSKESLRSAFLASAYGINDNDGYTAEYSEDFGHASEEEFNNFKNRTEETPVAVSQNEIENSVETPILCDVQNMMLQGHKGDELRNQILNKYAADMLAPHRDAIASLVSKQGFLGDTLVLVDLYKNASDAIHAIKTARVNPTFIAMRGDDVMGRLGVVASATGMAILDRSGLDVHTAAEIISKSASVGNVDGIVASNTLEKLASGNLDPASAIMAANMDSYYAKRASFERVANQTAVAFDSGLHNDKSVTGADCKFAVEEGAVRAIEAGISDVDTIGKMAGLVGSKTACELYGKALASAQVVSADVLTKCASQKYSLGSAFIKTASKCGSCTFSCGGYCSKQNAKFASDMGRVASTMSAEERVIAEALGNL